MENVGYAVLHCSTERTGMIQSMEVNWGKGGRREEEGGRGEEEGGRRKEGGGRGGSNCMRTVTCHILVSWYLDPACPLCMQHGGRDARESQ